MATVLNTVADRENFQLPEEAAKQIIEDSNGNLRKALLVMEALKMQS
jgi:replication factor C subunit 3/5